MRSKTRSALPASLLVGVLALLALSVLPWRPAQAGDWPRFRGPDGSGVSPETGFPTKWSNTESLAWKVDLPGPGTSSPIVSKGKVFVTCYSGYGVRGGDPGSPESLRRHVVCVDAASGKVLWDHSIPSKLPEEPFRGIGIPNHGYASSTPVADGERVFAFFGKTGVLALDFAGKELWRADASPDPRTHNFGTASSPVLAGDLVVVPASIECEAIVAFDKKTGKEAWRAPAEGYGGWWSTPILVRSGDAEDIVFNVPGEVWGLNPANGKLRWYAESFQDRGISPSAVAAEGIIYAIGGRQGGAAALRPEGKGDITKSVLWTERTGSYITSPVVQGKHLYWITDGGVANVLSLEKGERVVQKRVAGLGNGSVYASVVAAEGRLYLVTRRSGTLVLKATPELEELATNTFEGDPSDFNASPALSDGKLYIRSDRALYCVGVK